MAYWLLKTEPSIYSFEDFQADGCTMWDGIRNPQALLYIRSMKNGERVLIYHSGDERRIVGTGTIDGDPYADPDAGDPKLTVVDICVGERVSTPVTLSQVKADPLFADSVMVRQPRLSVIPISDEQWQQLAEKLGLENTTTNT